MFSQVKWCPAFWGWMTFLRDCNIHRPTQLLFVFIFCLFWGMLELILCRCLRKMTPKWSFLFIQNGFFFSILRLYKKVPYCFLKWVWIDLPIVNTEVLISLQQTELLWRNSQRRKRCWFNGQGLHYHKRADSPWL